MTTGGITISTSPVATEHSGQLKSKRTEAYPTLAEHPVDEVEDDDADSPWQATPFDLQRRPQPLNTNINVNITVTPHQFDEFKCPVCLDLLDNTYTAMDCLHRFCFECISSALRSGNKECPTCRAKLASKRSLRPDPNFDKLIAVMFPDRDAVNNYQLQLLHATSLQRKSSQVNAGERTKDSDAITRLPVTMQNSSDYDAAAIFNESAKRRGREMEEGMRRQAALSAPFIKRRRHAASATSTVLDEKEKNGTPAEFAADNTGEKNKAKRANQQQVVTNVCSPKRKGGKLKSNSSMPYVESDGQLVRVVIAVHEQQRWPEYKVRPRYLLIPLKANVEAVCRYLHYCIRLQSDGKTYADVKPARGPLRCAVDSSVKISDFEIYMPTVSGRRSNGGSDEPLASSVTMQHICEKYAEQQPPSGSPVNCIKLLYKYEPEEEDPEQHDPA